MDRNDTRFKYKYVEGVTCFREIFIVEFMSDINVPVAQLDRAAAF
jgi:hypothetical protein